MGTVIDAMRPNRKLAETLASSEPLVALREVAKLQPNVAIVRTRTAQDGRAEVSRG